MLEVLQAQINELTGMGGEQVLEIEKSDADSVVKDIFIVYNESTFFKGSAEACLKFASNYSEDTDIVDWGEDEIYAEA